MIKRLFSLVAFQLLFAIGIWAQVGMTETQILQYVIQQKKMGKSETDIATELLKQGATLAQIQQMRQKYSEQLEKVSMGGIADKAIGDASSRMRKNNAPLREIDEEEQKRSICKTVLQNGCMGMALIHISIIDRQTHSILNLLQKKRRKCSGVIFSIKSF